MFFIVSSLKVHDYTVNSSEPEGAIDHILTSNETELNLTETDSEPNQK